jgi:hypothetical protein
VQLPSAYYLRQWQRQHARLEQQAEAARKLGSFCQKLLPMVLLKKV